MLWLDDYERRARLVPGLFALFPIVILLAVFGLRNVPAVSYVLGALTVIGGPVLVAGVVRYYGKKAEAVLWPAWGGPPTTVLLRLTAPTDNELQRSLWRNAVEQVSGVTLCSLRSERANQHKADVTIETALKRTRDRTRDREMFALLFAENREYGFERNLYGIRWLGRALSITSVVAMAAYIITIAPALDRPRLDAANIFGLVACTAFLAGWCFWPSEGRVRAAADRYASELLHAAVTLHENGAHGSSASSTGSPTS